MNCPVSPVGPRTDAGTGMPDRTARSGHPDRRSGEGKQGCQAVREERPLPLGHGADGGVGRPDAGTGGVCRA